MSDICSFLTSIDTYIHGLNEAERTSIIKNMGSIVYPIHRNALPKLVHDNGYPHIVFDILNVGRCLFPEKDAQLSIAHRIFNAAKLK